MEQITYVGNYSDNGIEIYDFIDKKNLNKIGNIGSEKNNSYLAIYNEYLYSISEVIKNGCIISYKIQDKTLKKINIKSSKGSSPCHIAIDKSRSIIWVANYGDGSFIAYKINNDGSIGKELFYKQISEKSHLHNIQISKDFQALYLVDLGTDTIFKYRIYYDENKEYLELKETDRLVFEKETEPRHMVITDNNQIYVISEKACKLFKIVINKNQKMQVVEKINILTSNRHLEDTGCAIKTDSKNQYIYISIRGVNCISVYDIRDEKIKLIQKVSCEGKNPRDISLDAEEKRLLVANQTSNEITIFNIIEEGKLFFETKHKAEKPSCIVTKLK